MRPLRVRDEIVREARQRERASAWVRRAASLNHAADRFWQTASWLAQTLGRATSSARWRPVPFEDAQPRSGWRAQTIWAWLGRASPHARVERVAAELNERLLALEARIEEHMETARACARGHDREGAKRNLIRARQLRERAATTANALHAARGRLDMLEEACTHAEVTTAFKKSAMYLRQHGVSVDAVEGVVEQSIDLEGDMREVTDRFAELATVNGSADDAGEALEQELAMLLASASPSAAAVGAIASGAGGPAAATLPTAPSISATRFPQAPSESCEQAQASGACAGA
jgi:hypothetical protein